MSYLIGIDVGTTGTRAVVVEPDGGAVVGAATAEHPLSTPRPLWAEQDPEDWWRSTVSAVRGAVEAAGRHGTVEIAAVGLSGQMHGVVLLDERGEVLGPSLIWCDGRGQAECDDITARVGADRLIELTSNPALVGFSAGKLLWLRRHRPAEFERAHSFLLPKDFIRYRLTGEFATEVSDASGTLLFDVGRRTWSPEMLSALEIDGGLLPRVFESPEISGRVSASASRHLRVPALAAGTPVAGGGGDQAAGAVGNGIVRPGLVSSTIGSSGVVFAHCDRPVRDPAGRVHTFCHAVPGAWHVMGVTQAAGLSLRWFRDEIASAEERERAAAEGRDLYAALTSQAAEAAPGSDELLFLPYLMGERTPHLDPRARGVWFGLTAAHRRPQLVRSILEGVAFSLRDCLDILLEMGVTVREVRASGGGGRSDLWRQIQADVFERDVVTLNCREGPAYGAALIAGVGVGRWGSVPEACDRCLTISTRVTPDRQASEVYRRAHPLYKELYARVAPMFRAMS